MDNGNGDNFNPGNNNGGPMGDGPQGPQPPQPPQLPRDLHEIYEFEDPEYAIKGLPKNENNQPPVYHNINEDPDKPLIVEFVDTKMYNEFLNSGKKESLENELSTKLYGNGEVYESQEDLPKYIYPSENGFFIVKGENTQFMTIKISETGEVIKTPLKSVVFYKGKSRD